MTEFIVRLTDEQEALFRASRYMTIEHTSLYRQAMADIDGQIRAAIKLYDELVAEAKVKSE